MGETGKVVKNKTPGFNSYKEFVEQSADGFSALDRQGRIVLWNRRNEEIFGISREKAIGQYGWDIHKELSTISQITHKKIKGIHQEFHQFLKKQKVPWLNKTLERTLISSDGSLRYLECQFFPIDDHDAILGVVTRDITTQKKLELQLKNEKKKYQLLFEDAPVPYQSLDREGRFLEVNTQWLETLGYEKNEVLGKFFTDFLIEPDVKKFQQNFPKFIKDGFITDVQFQLKKSDGSVILVTFTGRISYEKDNTMVCTHCIFKDITKEKAMKVALRHSEENKRALLDAAPSAAMLIRPDGTVVDCNPELARRLKTTLDELIGKNIYDILPKKVAKFRRRKVDHVVETKKSLRFTDERSGYIIDNSISPIIQEDGSVCCVAVYGHDITKEYLADEYLRDLLEKFENLTQTTIDWVWETDNQGIYTYASSNVKKLMGYTPKQVIGKTPFDFMDTDEQARVQAIFAHHVKNKEPIVGLEDTLIHKNGKQVVFETNAVPHLDENGKLMGFFGTCRDVTENKKILTELKLSEQKFRNVVKNSPMGIGIVDSQGEIIDVNNALVDMLGYTRNELLQMNFRAFTHPDDLEKEDQLIREIWSNKRDTYFMTKRYIHKDGHIIWVDLVASLERDDQNKPVAGFAFVKDITEQKKAEELLKQSEEKYRFLADNIVDVVYTTDLQQNFTYVSPSVKKLFGYSPEELLSKNAKQILTKESYEIQQNAFKNTLKNNIFTPQTLEMQLRHKKGNLIWIEVNAALISNEKNKPSGIIGVCRDITDRKKMEEELKRSEQRFRSYFELGTVGMAIEKPTGEWIEVNQQLCSMFGYSKKELLKKHWHELTHPDDLEKDCKRFQRLIDGDIQQYSMEKRFFKKDGTVFSMFISVGCSRDEQDCCDRIFALAVDLSQRKEMEQQLQTILTHAPDIISRFDKNHRHLYVSPSVYEVTGIPPEQYIGKTNSELGMPTKLNKKWDHGISKVFQTGKTKKIEFTFVSIHGKTIFNTLFVPEINQDGKIETVFAFAHDITEQKKNQELLKKSQKELIQTLKATTDGIWSWDFITDKLAFSPRYYTMLGYEPYEFPATFDSWVSLIHKDDRKKAVNIAETYLKTKPDVYENEFRMKTKQGSYRWIHAHAEVVERDNEGHALRMIGNHEDITGRKQIEYQNQLLAEIIEHSNEFIGYADINEKAVYVNPAGKKMVGLDSDNDVKWTHILDYFLPEDKSFVKNTIIPTVENKGRWVGEFRFRHFKTGEPINVHYDLFRILDPLSQQKSNIATISQNITERKQAEKQLTESEQRLKEAEEIGRLGHVEYDIETQSIYWSNVMYHLYEKNPKDGPPTYEDVMNLHQPEDAKRLEQSVKKAIEKGKPYELDLKARLPSGKTAYYHSIGKPIRKKGKTIAIKGTVQDITMRKHAEEKLRSSEEKYHNLFNTMAQGVVYQDSTGKIISFNPAAANILGLSKKELLRRSSNDAGWKAIRPDGKPYPAEKHPAMRSLKNGKPIQNVIMGVFNPKQQQYKWINISAVPLFLRNEEKPHQVFTTFDDISDLVHFREKLEKSLQEKETLLKEVHHRVKNNLQIISTLLSLQKNQISDEQSLEKFSESQQRVQAMALVHEKLYRSSDLSSIDMRQYIKELLEEMVKTLGVDVGNIRLQQHIDEVSFDINTAIPCSLIINELISNAFKHAFIGSQKGSIDLLLKKEDENTYLLSVKDDGHGLPESVDWKHPHTLGLELVANLTRQLNGSVRVKNDNGTTFSIHFKKEEEEQ